VLPLDHIFHGRALTGTGLLWMVGNGSGRRRRGQLRVATQLTGRDLDERKEALRWEVREWEWRADKQRQQVAELMWLFGGQYTSSVHSWLARTCTGILCFDLLVYFDLILCCNLSMFTG
jgi:hypothetical protein